MNTLPNEFFIGEFPDWHYSRGSRAIIIKRKPSQIPHNIDWSLLEICAVGFMDGPNDRCYYQCERDNTFGQQAFDKMLKFLTECGWQLKEEPIV